MALYGIYGRHEIETCPLNNVDSAKIVLQAVNIDLSKVLPQIQDKQGNRTILFWTRTHVSLDS